MPSLEQIGEHAAIALLTGTLSAAGDDCAVLPFEGSPYDLVLTTDPLIEGIHFTPDTSPEQIGWKAAGRVVSDLAAMGAEPLYLLINLVAPPQEQMERLERIYAGVSTILSRFGAELTGGDLTQGPALELHVFGAGRVPKGRAVLRSAARAGDGLYVTGPLGCSFESGKHLNFIPRIEEAKQLRQSGLIHAMMDISDGLATDLRHLLHASGVGADLVSSEIPKNGTLEQALFDGEDYELLFTVSRAAEEAFDTFCRHAFLHPFFRIGTVSGRTDVLTLDGSVLEKKAFEHFRK